MLGDDKNQMMKMKVLDNVKWMGISSHVGVNKKQNHEMKVDNVKWVDRVGW